MYIFPKKEDTGSHEMRFCLTRISDLHTCPTKQTKEKKTEEKERKDKQSSCAQQTYLNINDQSVTQGNGDEEEGNRCLVL